MKKIELSAVLTVVGILILFSMAVAVTLIAPEYIDPSWKQASSMYQVQMHEIADPNVYVSTSNPGGAGLQYVYHLHQGETLLAFVESPLVRFIAEEDLAPLITRYQEEKLKLTSRLLLLRPPENRQKEEAFQKDLQEKWREENPGQGFPRFQIYELYDPGVESTFALTESDGIMENWIERNFTVFGDVSYPVDEGTIYFKNPVLYRAKEVKYLDKTYLIYDENGEPVRDLSELQKGDSQFLSRKELISFGQDIYRIEGCWYCHTDQTRTLVQDTVLNGSAVYPAPPSSANEYIYEQVSFPGTRRIGPDLSRVGVKRPHRDWHMSHFWSPQTESRGSIMPSFRHFFDDDPSGALRHPYSLPNYQFEAIFQYLMTRGTRITPPSEAWWLGKDPLQTLNIIEGGKE